MTGIRTLFQDRTLFGTVDIKITSDSERAGTLVLNGEVVEARSESETASPCPHFQIKFDLASRQSLDKSRAGFPGLMLGAGPEAGNITAMFVDDHRTDDDRENEQWKLSAGERPMV